MSFETLLNEEVVILERHDTVNELGERVYAWTSGSSFKCRLVPLSVEERLALPGEYRDANYKAYFLSSASITEADRIKWNDSLFNVVAVYTDSSHHHKTVILREAKS